MKSFLAHCKTNGAVIGGSRTACIEWAFKHVSKHPKSVINILVIRPKSNGKVIAEIDRDGGNWIFGGRIVEGQQLQKLIGKAARYG